MSLKSGASFLLIVVCTALVRPIHMELARPNFKQRAREMIKKCRDEGYQMPPLHGIDPTDSVTTGSSNSSENRLSIFLGNQNSGGKKDPLGQIPGAAREKMLDKMRNCTFLQEMLTLMKTFYDKTSSMTPAEKLKELVSVVKKVLKDMPEEKRKRVIRWLMKKYKSVKCKASSPAEKTGDTGTPAVYSSAKPCKPSSKGLDVDGMNMMEGYVCELEPRDLSVPKEKICEYADSCSSTAARDINANMAECLIPCFDGKKEGEKRDLGPLVCYDYDPPEMSPDLSKKLLKQLVKCENPGIKALRYRLLGTLLPLEPDEAVELGSLLPLEELEKISAETLKNGIKNGKIHWKNSQAYTVIRILLQGKDKCKSLTHEEVKDYKSVAAGFPRCVLKQLNAVEMLQDKETLRAVSRNMGNGQKKSLLQKLQSVATTSELLEKLPCSMLEFVSLRTLKKDGIADVNITCEEEETLPAPKARFLIQNGQPDWYQRLARLVTLIRGVSCELIDEVAKDYVWNMANALSQCPMLGKLQARCAAKRLFQTLEATRTDYFKTITEAELEAIPATMLIHLSPSKVEDLPDNVCPKFLQKIDNVDLDSLPRRSRSRRALAERALECLTLGGTYYTLTPADVYILGELVCEVSAPQLRLMDADVMEDTLLVMGDCDYIPRRNRDDLKKLIVDTYGDPCYWSEEDFRALGPLVLDEDTINCVRASGKPWLKKALQFLRLRLRHIKDKVEVTLFELTVPEAGRRKRAAGGSVVTASAIQQLEDSNVLWTAAQLDTISVETFKATVEILGDITTYRADQVEKLAKKAIEAYGDVSQMTEGHLVTLRCISQGFSDTDLQTLPFSLDIIEDIAKCGWTQQQLVLLWKNVAAKEDLASQALEADQMITLGKVICGLNASEMNLLDKEAFEDAVANLDLQPPCDLAQWKDVAVSVFGESRQWTQEQVGNLGNIMAAVDATDLASYDVSYFSLLWESCVPLIPNLAVLSDEQLTGFGPDNAAMITEEQKATLSASQRAAVEEALTGSPRESDDTSGAPSMSVEGMMAFTKPLLVFLVGFLLL